jgi:hypothetical protein
METAVSFHKPTFDPSRGKVGRKASHQTRCNGNLETGKSVSDVTVVLPSTTNVNAFVVLKHSFIALKLHMHKISWLPLF